MSASRYALVALVAAMGLAAVGIAGRVWAFIPALIAAVFAAVDVLLAWRGAGAAATDELRELLDGTACRVGVARASEYGVDLAALPDGQDWHYIRRDFETELGVAIGAALAGEASPLVMLCGETKSGKTRAAFQALSADELSDAWLVVPRTGASVEVMLRPGSLPRHWSPLVVWLDDVERYASVDASGLHAGTLRNLQCDRPVVLLATEGGRGVRNQPSSLLEDPVEQLRNLATSIEVPLGLSKSELEDAARSYDSGLVAEIEQLGVGRRMVAMGGLRQRLKRSRSPEGIAVFRAAVDWRRAGALRPLGASELELLYRYYLAEELDPNAELFAAGLSWAREPLPGSNISLLRRAKNGGDTYEPYDLAVELARGEWPKLNRRAMAQIANLAEPQDCFQMAAVAYDSEDRVLALALLVRAERSEDRRLAAVSAFNVGILLTDGRDLVGAEEAYRRADERGSLRGAYNLGQMRRHAGDLQGAEAAYRRADERGSPDGAVNLGILLERRGDWGGAEAAYRRAEERGSSRGRENLGALLGDGAALGRSGGAHELSLSGSDERGGRGG
jgi:tetratricopeptide (TPR) repeat protein